MDAVLICVPTPLHEDHTPDMSYRGVDDGGDCAAPARRAAGGAGEHDVSGDDGGGVVATIDRVGASRGVQVLRSASPEELDGTRLDGVMVAFSPEREDPGNMSDTAAGDSEGDWRCGCAGDAAAAALCMGACFEQTVPMARLLRRR